VVRDKHTELALLLAFPSSWAAVPIICTRLAARNDERGAEENFSGRVESCC